MPTQSTSKKTLNKFTQKQYLETNNNKSIHEPNDLDNAIKCMFKHPKTGKTINYATMRYYYG